MAITCKYCGERPAIGVQREVGQPTWSDKGGGHEIPGKPVKAPICARCKDYWFDGTEEYPELLDLSTLRGAK